MQAPQPPSIGHEVVGEGQVAAQRPPEHTSPRQHPLPQAPQLFASVMRSTHVAPQVVCPVRQGDLQMPAAQPRPDVQTWPQPPQFSGSS